MTVDIEEDTTIYENVVCLLWNHSTRNSVKGIYSPFIFVIYEVDTNFSGSCACQCRSNDCAAAAAATACCSSRKFYCILYGEA